MHLSWIERRSCSENSPTGSVAVGNGRSWKWCQATPRPVPARASENAGSYASGGAVGHALVASRCARTRSVRPFAAHRELVMMSSSILDNRLPSLYIHGVLSVKSQVVCVHSSRFMFSLSIYAVGFCILCIVMGNLRFLFTFVHYSFIIVQTGFINYVSAF